MRIENADKQIIKELSHNLSSKLLTHPLFMYYCPEKAVRRDFICAYVNYYVHAWSQNEILLTNDDKTVMISIVNPRQYGYKFTGKGAGAMKNYKLSPNIFEHQNEIEEIFDVIVPDSKDGRVMLIYSNIGADFDEVQKLINEAIQIADEEGFVLLYDTFSLRLQPLMREHGFKLVYNKSFLNTNFLHSVMVYNF